MLNWAKFCLKFKFSVLSILTDCSPGTLKAKSERCLSCHHDSCRRYYDVLFRFKQILRTHSWAFVSPHFKASQINQDFIGAAIFEHFRLCQPVLAILREWCGQKPLHKRVEQSKDKKVRPHDRLHTIKYTNDWPSPQIDLLFCSPWSTFLWWI